MARRYHASTVPFQTIAASTAYAALLVMLTLMPLCTERAWLPLPGAYAVRQVRFVDYLGRKKREQGGPLGHGESAVNSDSEVDCCSDVVETRIEQRLDHFSEHGGGGSTGSFHQRYFYTRRFVAAAAANANTRTYAFVCMGGEGPALTKRVLVDSVHCTGDMIELAKRLHQDQGADVYLFALEHRYYGESYPDFFNRKGGSQSPVLNKNLVYLSSRQALADFAHFMTTVRSSLLAGAKNTKVVTFGGSYPGMLAAWARYKFPHIVHAAVSNSAPVQAELDFFQYNEHVWFDLGLATVGGEASCQNTISEGHKQIATALLDEEHDDAESRRVAEMFNLCDGGAAALRDSKNASAFLGDGVIYIPAQANDPACHGELCNIRNICSFVNDQRSSQDGNQTEPIEILAEIARQQNNGTCVEVNWEGTIRYISSAEAQVEGTRSWLWQTCTEFGFYQTCEKTSLCPYGKGFHPLGLDFEICERCFGVDRNDVRDNVQDSLDYYGGWGIESSRIMFVNGEVDPWAMLGVTVEHAGANKPTLWVKGASHHFWTHPVKDTDGYEIVAARDAIYRQVMIWLDEGLTALI